MIAKYTSRALRDLSSSQIPKLKKKEVKVINQWRELRLPQLRTLVHQRENEVINQALVEVTSMTEEEVDALLDQSETNVSLDPQ